MRRILVLFPILSFLAANAQYPEPTLQVNLFDCRQANNIKVPCFPALRLYRLPADTVSYQFAANEYRNAGVSVNNFLPGIYRLEYVDMYNQKISKVYNLNECGRNQITLCLDELEEYPVQSLATLKEGDSIVLNSRFSACFSWSEEKMIIMRHGDRYHVRFIPVARGKVATSDSSWNRVESRLLTAEQMKAFTRFENELMKLGTNRCEGLVSYRLLVPGKITEYTDRDCVWNGYTYLKKTLLEFERQQSLRFTIMLGFEPE